MKKIIISLFLFIALGVSAQWQSGYNAAFYSICNGGEPQLIGMAYNPPPYNTNGYIAMSFDFCGSCKLEIRLTKLNQYGLNEVDLNQADYKPISNTATADFIDNDGQHYTNPIPLGPIKTEVVDGHNIWLYQLDLSNINEVQKLTYIRIPVAGGGYQQFIFSNNRIIPGNNKDNMDFAIAGPVCKGDCLNMRDLIPNLFDNNYASKASIVSLGCGADAQTGEYLNNEQICFNEVGAYTMCATIKDACGEKNITKTVEVKDCAIKVNCQQCCSYIQNRNITIQFNPLTRSYYLSSPMGEMTPCGDGYFEITYADGTKSYASGSYILGDFAGNVTTICYKVINCPECTIPCVNVR